MDAINLEQSTVKRIPCDSNLSFNISRYIEMDFIDQETFDTLDDRLKEILWTLLENNSPKSKKYMKNAISLTLKIWKYPYKLDDILSYEAMFFCAVEIAYSAYCESDAFHRLEWCHKILNSLNEDDLRNGWRVCFVRNTYYYVNHKTRQMKKIIFRRGGGKN